MNILIVEDDAVKYGHIVNLIGRSATLDAQIRHVVNAADAAVALSTNSYDLMILDVNIPRRNGEASARGGGLLVLKEIEDDASLHRPRYVVGLTAYEDTIAEFGDKFRDKLWLLIHYTETVDKWRAQLSDLLKHIQLASASRNFSDGVTFGYDVALICALPQVELAAIRNAPVDWSDLKIPSDETRYMTASIPTVSGPRSIIAACAPRMGMPAASVLAAKVIMQFRPRILAMAGICAGRSAKTSIGDVIVADPVWDYGSGKIEGGDNGPSFLPSAHQLPLDPDFGPAAAELAGDVAWLAKTKHAYPGGKPNAELAIRVGPMASGAAVVADKATFDEIAGRQRDVLAIEMEAYGVFAAGAGCGKPRPRCLVAKSVSDFADKDKGDDYQAYAAYTSVNVIVEMIRRGLIERQ